MTLAAMLDDAAARSPHAVAIHTSAGSLSYAELAQIGLARHRGPGLDRRRWIPLVRGQVEGHDLARGV
jgi:hypothetical protein